MKIFVAKLSPKTTKIELRNLFRRYGEVSACKVIIDHETGFSKCYGFVEMPNEAEAYKAIVETDETVFMGSELQVKKSRPQNSTEKTRRHYKPQHQNTPEENLPESNLEEI